MDVIQIKIRILKRNQYHTAEHLQRYKQTNQEYLQTLEMTQTTQSLKDFQKQNGLTKGKPIYDCLICSHYHSDHIGRINEVLPTIPVYLSNISRTIYERVFVFSKSKGNITRATTDIKDGVSIKIKDLTITSYVVDHSAYDARMILIETADGKKILHTRRFQESRLQRQTLI